MTGGGGLPIAELDTPVLLVDAAALERNLVELRLNLETVRVWTAWISPHDRKLA